MTKKNLLSLVLAAFVAGGAFAQSFFSVGGGLVFDGGGIGSGEEHLPPHWGSYHTASIRHFGFGGWVFVGIPFAELSVGLMGGPSTLNVEHDVHMWSGDWSRDGSFFALDISLLGKLPFYLGGIDIFPLFGFGSSIVLSHDGFRWNPSDLSTFRIKFGAGGDFDISRDMFIRGSLLGSRRFPFPAEWGGYFTEGAFGVTVKAGIGLRL